MTGQGALDWAAAQSDALRSVAALVKGTTDDVEEKVQQLLDRSRKLEKEVAQLKSKLASGQGTDLSAQAVQVGGMNVVAARVDGADAAALREAVDQLKNKLKSAAIVLASVDVEQKITLIAGVTVRAARRPAKSRSRRQGPTGPLRPGAAATVAPGRPGPGGR